MEQNESNLDQCGAKRIGGNSDQNQRCQRSFAEYELSFEERRPNEFGSMTARKTILVQSNQYSAIRDHKRQKRP